jgi:hypothetical protein
MLNSQFSTPPKTSSAATCRILSVGSGADTVKWYHREKPLPATPLIIYTFSAGRFGNQFLRFLHWTAWVRELDNECSVLHLPFWPYANLFSEWSRRPGCIHPARVGAVDLVARIVDHVPAGRRWDINWKLQRITLRASRGLQSFGVDLLDKPIDEIVNMEDRAFVDRARAARYLVCAGWEYSCWSWLERHAPQVRRQFVPVPMYGDRAESFIADLRGRYDVLIGLFARRGDYRKFFDGRFYYPWSDYARWAREAMDHYPGKRVVIVAAGDDPIPIEAFEGLPVVLTTGSVNSGGHWLESFLELAHCDILLGPPSTFVACAAFYGDKPWWPLRSAGQSLRSGEILERHIFDAARDPELALSVR